MLAFTVTGFMLAASARLAAGLLSPDEAATCDCYSTVGDINGLYTSYASYDFRHQSQHAGVPPLITDCDQSASAPVTSAFFNANNWTDNWSIQTWQNDFKNGNHGDDSTIQMTNSANNIYIEANTDPNPASDTFLTLRSARLPDFQSVAEFDASNYIFQYVSSRMYARILGDAGTCASMFSYEGNTNPVQEADIEFLTKDPKNVGQYTNQPGSMPGSTSNATLPVPIDEWAVHRYDWTDGVSTWYVNDQQVAQIQMNTPRLSLMMIFNNWSNGNEWTGVMDVGQSAHMQIQWIEIAYNTTVANSQTQSASRLRRRSSTATTSTEPACNNVCHLDGAPSHPTPPDPTPVPSVSSSSIAPSMPSSSSSAVVSSSAAMSSSSAVWSSSAMSSSSAVWSSSAVPSSSAVWIPSAVSISAAVSSSSAMWNSSAVWKSSPMSSMSSSSVLPSVTPTVVTSMLPPVVTSMMSPVVTSVIPPVVKPGRHHRQHLHSLKAPPTTDSVVALPSTTFEVEAVATESPTSCTAGGIVFDISVHQSDKKSPLARRSLTSGAPISHPVMGFMAAALAVASVLLL